MSESAIVALGNGDEFKKLECLRRQMCRVLMWALSWLHLGDLTGVEVDQGK